MLAEKENKKDTINHHFYKMMSIEEDGLPKQDGRYFFFKIEDEDECHVSGRLHRFELIEGEWFRKHYSHWQERVDNDKRDKEISVLKEAMQEFVDRVERFEIRSKKTYTKFKELLNK